MNKLLEGGLARIVERLFLMSKPISAQYFKLLMAHSNVVRGLKQE